MEIDINTLEVAALAAKFDGCPNDGQWAAYGKVVRLAEGSEDQVASGCGEEVAAFIAAANPAVVLELIAMLHDRHQDVVRLDAEVRSLREMRDIVYGHPIRRGRIIVVAVTSRDGERYHACANILIGKPASERTGANYLQHRDQFRSEMDRIYQMIDRHLNPEAPHAHS
ncbi:hypothetical protein [Bradyrhizobium sp. cf659]|uniref:hypothetical protein n=1 Tax=Bradyrhizobium sp. cf659 TaxID=1761771 RepID=UPI0008EAE0B2|nr:hypothetical protein [Bradyrhizobium sp. cf659]SFJ85354.1 hypothetical protein SAMN04487925_112113 [Bradyrhizobium sp. cf659]